MAFKTTFSPLPPFSPFIISLHGGNKLFRGSALLLKLQKTPADWDIKGPVDEEKAGRRKHRQGYKVESKGSLAHEKLGIITETN